MSQEQARPGHATLAGSIIVGCSVIVVLSAWERISTLRTIESQEALQRTLADPPMSGLGLTVDGYTDLLQTLCVIGAAAATAAAILGVQVFKRSTSARLALTGLSPVLLVGGLAAGDFFGPMVVTGIVLLWLQPTRDWYAGRPWAQAHEQRRAERLADLRPPNSPTVPPAAVETPPQHPVGSGGPAPASPGPVLPGPAPAGPVFGEPVQQYARPGDVRRTKPQALVAACALTWVTSTVVLVGLGLTAAFLPSQSKDLLAEVTREEPRMVEVYEVTENSLLIALYLMLVVFAIWAVAAIVLAWLAYVGQNWARITLVVSAITAGVLVLAVAIGAWPLLILVVVFGTSAWMLLRPEVGRWYQR
ncbi:MAG: hypothetical protein NTX33_03810 [Propionibacteriales bacterium]|nr:hypothetical protein [Propionibacteriales bacterium]